MNELNKKTYIFILVTIVTDIKANFKYNLIIAQDVTKSHIVT